MIDFQITRSSKMPSSPSSTCNCFSSFRNTIFTARIRSTREGNVFSLSTGGGGAGGGGGVLQPVPGPGYFYPTLPPVRTHTGYPPSLGRARTGYPLPPQSIAITRPGYPLPHRQPGLVPLLREHKRHTAHCGTSTRCTPIQSQPGRGYPHPVLGWYPHPVLIRG